ncbi:hypothetical protein [Corynebacterium casei]|uniref:Uncharacterized protein n=1 Tax=Corynebacterium casei LMG S-19264 TaxID=1285583 RepID=A0ABN4CE77_9CORY|nr:hypothetical protein [Corynebacterium casei]AHI20650.1 hypothetical protein CCASEI_10475 [Corynebacterium casei LMG S-19264]
MIERKLPALIFGNVVIESSLLGGELRVYGEDWCSYSTGGGRAVQLKYPLDEMRSKVDAETAQQFSEQLLQHVEDGLEATYTGGVERAKWELCRWLLRDEDV